MSSHKNPLDYSFSYYPECSQNELLRYKRLKREREQFELNEKETAEETRMLSEMKAMLPNDLIKLVGEFSPVVKQQQFLVKVEYFERWISENTERIMSLIDNWTKQHVGFVLTRIIQLDKPTFNAYLKGVGNDYNRFTKLEMSRSIKYYISLRSKQKRYEFKMKDWVFPHYFVPSHLNPAIDDLDPVRIYGAYKAVEEYNNRLKDKMSK